MRHNQLLLEKIKESLASVLPITAIVLIISITVAPLTPGTMVLFLFGAVLLVVGMGLFTLGVDMSMIPMGDGIGVQISKARRVVIPLVVCFVLGFVVTMAEPDLQVLAEQLPSVPNMTLILVVAVGVGFFLVVAQVRMLLNIPLSYMLVFFYLVVFALSFFVPESFVPAAFDSGGVTTGPITVPFIMALGIGLAAVRSDKNSSNDSFGLVLFLTGVNVGFLPAGATIGGAIASGGTAWLLVPIGAVVGYFIVRAEPAVRVLARQVEEISNGSITQKAINRALSIGIAISVGLAMLRILTGISILWFLIPGYAVALIMTFFVPQIFTGVAFDSGGVASGPMTTTFLLPLAMGACEAVGGNVLTDAFGIVALVAMTPLFTIQLMGLVDKLKSRASTKALRQAIHQELESLEEGVIYWEE